MKRTKLRAFIKNEEGSMSIVILSYFSLFLVAMIAASIQILSYRVVCNRVEDALVASNLAAEVIDVREYGLNQEIRIQKADSYSIFQNALAVNLEGTGQGGDHLLGTPQIETFVIYNVQKNGDVEVSEMTNGGRTYVVRGGANSLRCPDGSVVSKSGLYAKVRIPYNGIWGTNTSVLRDCHTDVRSIL